MAYCEVSEIEQDFKDMSITSSSNVSIADVEGFIVECDALIDAYIGNRYVVPVTAGAGLTLLKLLSRSLVVARIKRLLAVKQEKSTDANQNVADLFLSPTQVMKILENIRDDVTSLAGATALVSSGGFYSSNVANSVTPVVKKDEKQW